MEPFVLELTENPHPRMREAALELRRTSRPWWRVLRRREWRGYLASMCDATGEPPEAINAWLDRHEGG